VTLGRRGGKGHEQRPAAMALGRGELRRQRWATASVPLFYSFFFFNDLGMKLCE